MATLTFTGSRPTPRQKSVLVVGQVNAEPITVVVDESWSGLQLELQFFNSTTHPEVPVVVILDSTMTCKVPPEVTKEVGIVHVALAGRDSGTIIKLSEKLYYADAKIGADPQGGLTPEQQTPDYIAQMIAIQEETKAVAQSVRTDADNGLFDGEPGKSPIIKNGNWWIWDVEAQEYRDTGVAASGGGGGTTDYTTLTNKPSINGVELSGNKTADDLNLQPKGDYATTSGKLANPYSITFAGAVEASYDGSKAVTVTIPTIAGPAGVSPTVSTKELDNGTRVTFTFKGGAETVDILNGKTPVKGIDYFTDEEIRAIASQAAELVPGGRPSVPQTPQIDYTLQEDSRIVYFDELDGIPLSNYGFTYARIYLENSPQDVAQSSEGCFAINVQPNSITAQVTMSNQFVWTTSKKYVTGWIDTKTGEAISVAPNSQPTWRNTVSCQMIPQSPGGIIESIGFRSAIPSIPFPSETIIKVWFA